MFHRLFAHLETGFLHWYIVIQTKFYIETRFLLILRSKVGIIGRQETNNSLFRDIRDDDTIWLSNWGANLRRY